MCVECVIIETGNQERADTLKEEETILREILSKRTVGIVIILQLGLSINGRSGYGKRYYDSLQ